MLSPMLTMPLRYSIRLRSESSAAALLKNPRPSVLAYRRICMASMTVDLPLPEWPVKKLIFSLKERVRLLI